VEFDGTGTLWAYYQCLSHEYARVTSWSLDVFGVPALAPAVAAAEIADELVRGHSPARKGRRGKRCMVNRNWVTG
jgi:hypothetical protein